MREEDGGWRCQVFSAFHASRFGKCGQPSAAPSADPSMSSLWAAIQSLGQREAAREALQSREAAQDCAREGRENLNA